MAYQNFFTKSDNYKRRVPVQVSGKELKSEFRMRNDGRSSLVVECVGTEVNDKEIKVTVVVHDPNGYGRIVSEHEFICPK